MIPFLSYRVVRTIRRQYLADARPALVFPAVRTVFISYHRVNQFSTLQKIVFKNMIIPAVAKIHALFKQKMANMCLLTLPGIIKCPAYPSHFQKTSITGRKRAQRLQELITSGL